MGLPEEGTEYYRLISRERDESIHWCISNGSQPTLQILSFTQRSNQIRLKEKVRRDDAESLSPHHYIPKSPSSVEHAQWVRGQEGYKATRRRRSWRLPEDPPLPCNKCVTRKSNFSCLVNFYSLWGRGDGDCENRLKAVRLVLADLVSVWAHNAPWLDLDDPSSCLVEKNSYVIWIFLFIVGLFINFCLLKHSYISGLFVGSIGFIFVAICFVFRRWRLQCRSDFLWSSPTEVWGNIFNHQRSDFEFF